MKPADNRRSRAGSGARPSDASGDRGQNDGRWPTVAQLRDDIDSGRTGDKVAATDPAAAPLGTDAEAGGTAPTGKAAARARQAESASGPDGTGKRDVFRPSAGLLAWLAVAAGIVAAIIVALSFALP